MNAKKNDGLIKAIFVMIPILLLDIVSEIWFYIFSVENVWFPVLITILLIGFSSYRGSYIFNSKIFGYLSALIYFLFWRIFIVMIIGGFIFYDINFIDEFISAYFEIVSSYSVLNVEPDLFFVSLSICFLIFLAIICLYVLLVAFPFLVLGKRKGEKSISKG